MRGRDRGQLFRCVLWSLLSFALLTTGACGYSAIGSEGDFGGQPFRPTGTVFALGDAHSWQDDAQGIPRVVDRDRPTVKILMCEAPIDPDMDFAAMSGQDILALRKTFAESDRVYIDELDATLLEVGAQLKAGPNDDDFAIMALAGERVLNQMDIEQPERPLGRILRASLVVEALDLREGGHLQGSLTLLRSRASEQPAGTLIGQVTIHFDAPIVGERIGESNLKVLNL